MIKIVSKCGLIIAAVLWTIGGIMLINNREYTPAILAFILAELYWIDLKISKDK